MGDAALSTVPNERRADFAPIVADLMAHLTGTPVEAVEVGGSTRPPTTLPAVRVRVLSAGADPLDRSMLGGSKVTAEVVVYADPDHPLTFDPRQHVQPGHVGMLAGRRAFDHGDVAAMERDGNSRSATLADGTTATLHRLIFRGLYETVPAIPNVSIGSGSGIPHQASEEIIRLGVGIGRRADVTGRVMRDEVVATTINSDGIRRTTVRGRVEVMASGPTAIPAMVSQAAAHAPTTLVGRVGSVGRVAEVRHVEGNPAGHTFDYVCLSKMPSATAI